MGARQACASLLSERAKLGFTAKLDLLLSRRGVMVGSSITGFFSLQELKSLSGITV